MTQLILYDQLGIHYCYDDVSQYLFLLSSQNPISPYGPLHLNPFSKKIEHEASKNLIIELENSGKQANWNEVFDYESGIREYADQYNINTFIIMTPSEPSLLRQLEKIQVKLKNHNIEIIFRPNKQFLISHDEFVKQYPRPPVMENFYRWMRKKFNILMDGDKPLGWKRNYDEDNRKFDKKYTPLLDTVIEYPTSRSQALSVLQNFISDRLDRFGELEDAMYSRDDHVHHSLISTSINFGLLTPLEVITAVAQADTALNNKEWFIRQILGWREYMYHRFWSYKDTIYTTNVLNHTLPLSQRFRRPEQSPLQMNCINHILKTVKNTGYSHHITRLMIIGNFTLLMWYNPHDVNKRFWEMYADAFERVVTPNVLGMSQFADGGNLATKPYISSANYINNMSDYCKTCFYDPKIKSWPKACPMNYLYWNFIDKHRDLFKRQPYIVSNLDKVDIDDIKRQANEFISTYGTLS